MGRHSALAIRDLSDWKARSANFPEPPSVSEDRSRSPHRTVNPKRVLVVEDNIDSARTLTMLLGEMGHRAEYAINGYAALTALKTFRPAVVILDLGLPGLTGFEVCHQIKAREETKHIRVVVLTAYPAPALRERSLASGCEVHLVKPVVPEVLEDILR